MKLEWDFHELTEFGENLGNLADLEKTFKRIAKDIAKALLKRMKSLTPAETYELINGWEGNHFVVTKKGNNFEVLVVNKAPHAMAANDGHIAKNQYGGEYKIHTQLERGPFGKLQGRIQVRSPHQWQKGDPTYFVFGHFFVERGILQLTSTKEVEEIIMRELQKWWDSV